jgi:Carbohydrate esterase, sialic acid-specific acetylesterase
MRVNKIMANTNSFQGDVWVLAGQSNMEGCGWLAGVLPPDERVSVFGSDGVWRIAQDPLHWFWESITPVHQELRRAGMIVADRQIGDEEWARLERAARRTGAGLGISFGKAMADATGKSVGLIAAAHGGTSLEQWSPRYKSMGGRSLYGAMLQRIRMAGGNLRGILWYQGESDTTTMEAANTYAQRFDEWIAAVRADTGIAHLPIITVQIGRVIEPPAREGLWLGWDVVREAQRTLPSRTVHATVTSTVDLPLVDLIHIDTGGLIRLGRRMARLALAGAQLGPEPAQLQRFVSPAGICNAIRVSFKGVAAAGWACPDAARVSGFEVWAPDAQFHPPLYVVNAWVDPTSAGSTDIIVLLNREMDAGTRLGYGMGLNPVCDLVDADDTPLLSFMPQPVG